MRNEYFDVKTGASASLVKFKDGKKLTRIFVPHQYRSVGYGSAMLSRVLRDADSENLPLYLHISADKDATMNDKVLRAWYERHGFVEYSLFTWRREPCARIESLKLRPKKTVAAG